MKIGNFDIFSSEEEPEIHMEVIPISMSEMAKDVSEDQEESEEEEDPFPEQLPILPVKNMVLFPGALSSITIRRDSALELINDARDSRLIGVVSQRSNEEEATPENLKQLLGKGRTKLGMYDGDLKEGELEIGQVSSLIEEIKTVKEVFEEVLAEFQQTRDLMINITRH